MLFFLCCKNKTHKGEIMALSRRDFLKSSAAASAAAAQSGLAAPAVFAGTLGLLNGITLALGAAQMAVVAGSTYSGGGGSPSAGSPQG